MLGAIAGDIIGSLHEFEGTKTTEFPLFTARSSFTDDTVLTIATAEKLLGRGSYAALYRKWGDMYPDAGYGGRFREWLATPGAGPYNSFGNGSAMRVSPVAYAYSNLVRVLAEAEASARVTHNHPEGIRGAQAVAAAVFLARTGKSAAEIREYITWAFKYDLTATVGGIRRRYVFNETCQGSVPQAIICALSSESYVDAVRKAVSLGGDADTLACIAGAIAEPLHGGLPRNIAKRVHDFLPPKMLAVLDAFECRFMGKPAPELEEEPIQEKIQPGRPRPLKLGNIENRGRIIVLDDCARYLKMQANFLKRRCDLEIFATTDSVEALEEALRQPPLVFISDIVHPGINGIELLKRLKRSPRTRKTKVWIASGSFENPKLIALAEKHGADLLLCKPFRLDSLLEELGRVVGRAVSPLPVKRKGLNKP